MQTHNKLPQELLDNVITNIADAVLVLDPKGNILMLNREGERIYDISTTEAVGRPFAEIGLMEGRLDPVNDLILASVGQPNELLDKDVAITMQDSTEKHFRVRTGLLREPTDNAVIGLTVVLSDITERVHAMRERTESGMFLITVILSLLTAVTVNGIILRAYQIDPYSAVFSWVYMLIMLVPVILYIIWTKMPRKDYGVTLNNWRQSLYEGTLLSIAIFVTGFVIVAMMQPEGKSIWDLIQPSRLAGEFILSYVPHTLVQELVSRGVILGAMGHMFRDYSKWLPIALSALIFGFLHAHIGFIAVVLTFFFGLVLGWMYLRHGNLIGVTLAHIVLGGSAYLFGLI
ncbi:MAG: type II CAAX prenyl endopeptidase Rce1 family protein [Thiolinea sp.]